jgi:hypothetical protein
MNDVLDFGGHFLSLRRDRFFKRGGFSTATGFFANNHLGRFVLVSVVGVMGILSSLSFLRHETLRRGLQMPAYVLDN